MQNGFYVARFGTPFGSGVGVLLAEDGIFKGGDASFYYTGSYRVDGNNHVTAKLRVRRHSSGAISVFGKDDVEVDLGSNGHAQNTLGGSYNGVNFTVVLNMLPT